MKRLGIVPGGTELSLILGQEHFPETPLLDTTLLHARDAVDRMMERGREARRQRPATTNVSALGGWRRRREYPGSSADDAGDRSKP